MRRAGEDIADRSFITNGRSITLLLSCAVRAFGGKARRRRLSDLAPPRDARARR
jgi:hypothetical protein